MLSDINRPDETVLPETLWIIVLSYTHGYVAEMNAFCKNILWDFLKEPIRRTLTEGSKECAVQTQVLLEKAAETAAIVLEAAKNIETITARHTSTNHRLLEQKIAQNCEAAQQEIANKTDKITGEVIKLQQQIADCELEITTKLEQQNAQARKKAFDELNATLQQDSETGAISAEKRKQVEAQRALEQQQQQLANSSSLFEEIQWIKQFLTEFPDEIKAEIETKGRWDNRIRMRTSKDFDTLWGTTDTKGRLYRYIQEVAALWLNIACFSMPPTMCLAITTLALLSMAAIVPTHVPVLILLSIFFIGPASFGLLLGAIIAPIKVSVDFYPDTPERFENFTVARVFSPELLTKFDEIKHRIKKFQVTNTAITKPDATHPLVNLDENKEKVSSFREAMGAELTFFNDLYLKSPVYKAQHTEQEEKQSAMVC